MGAAYDRVTDALTHATGYHATGNGNWRCPAHPDNNPSLKVSNGDGRVLINCHANCDIAQILAALDLTYVDLYDEPAKATRPQKRIVDAYHYEDETGTLLYQVVRYDPKGFGQRRPHNGDWTWTMGDVRRVLYKLPQVVAAIADGAPIWIVEGEKDVHALEREGEIATTSPGGAGKWRPEYSESLRGAHVIIVADNDEPGRKHADHVAAALEGIAASIERRQPATGHKDIADHLGAGLALGQLVDPDNVPPAAVELYQPIDWTEFWADEPIATEWLIEPVLPITRQVAIFSAAKAGKSLLSLEIAAALATGQPCLDSPTRPPINVVYIDMEMTRDDLRERLLDLGHDNTTDLTHLHYYQLSELPPLDTDRGGIDLAQIVTWHNADLVVLDTMARAVAGDENEADTYRAFYRHTGRKLKALRVALLRLDHAGKASERGQRGSSAKADDVDVVFRMTVERDNVTLTRTHSRVAWVPETVQLQRTDTGNLRHIVTTGDTYPAGTADVAALLDTYDIPLDATVKTAQTTLRAHKDGRRQVLIQAALRYRRQATK